MSKVKINSGSGKKVKINSPTGTPVRINEPQNVSVYVANHLYGAVASITQSTDTLAANAGAGELAGFKHNIQLTAYISPYEAGPSEAQVAPIYATGKIQYGLYIPSNRWKDPSDGLVRTIADYAATTWTAAGVTAFGATLGAAKTANYPNHGQEMFDLTLGDLGWDASTGLGLSNGEELFGMMEEVDDIYEGLIGRKLSVGAYRFGRTQPATMLIKCLLGGRNSLLNFVNLSGDAYTNYGENNSELLGLPEAVNTRQGRLNHPCSTRTFDESVSFAMGTFAQAKTFLTGEVQKTILNGGYLMDFTHWHTVTTAPQVDEIIAAMAAGIASEFVYRGDMGSIVEYLFLRDMASVSATLSGGEIQVNVSFVDPYKTTYQGIDTTILYDKIEVPISIVLDTTGTTLEGVELTTSNGTIIKVSPNVFVVNIPFAGAEGVASTTLIESGSPIYLNFDLPVIETMNRDATTLSVTTDINTKAVLFKVASGGAESSSTVHARSNNFATSHSFDVTSLSGQDLRVGVISETKQSILSSVI